MSVPSYDSKIGAAELKAPAGQYRLVRTFALLEGVESFYLRDYPEKERALREWRTRKHSHDSRTDYHLYDDQGRRVGHLGTFIKKEDQKAPAGMVRVVCVDIAPELAGKRPADIYLVEDTEDRAGAIARAREAMEGPGDPYVGYQVYDDTGTALIQDAA